jgi:hypothetical protein
LLEFIIIFCPWFCVCDTPQKSERTENFEDTKPVSKWGESLSERLRSIITYESTDITIVSGREPEIYYPR